MKNELEALADTKRDGFRKDFGGCLYDVTNAAVKEY